MKKQSMMGSSKYEFNPNQLDIDIQQRNDNISLLESKILDLLDNDKFGSVPQIRFENILRCIRKINEENNFV